ATPFECRGNPVRRERRQARGDHRDARARLLDGDRDGDELHRQLGQPRRHPRPGDHRVPARRHPGGARPRPAVRRPHQGALRHRARLHALHARAVVPAAAGEDDGHRPRHPGRHRGRDRRDRALQPRRRGDGWRRSGDQRHGRDHPARRGGSPSAVRGIPQGVRGRGHRL
ncbi:MAG: DNA protection during starvation protein, partial [uncultured Solirubrobacteraceae bacterium]